jgi:hypothetical protein
LRGTLGECALALNSAEVSLSVIMAWTEIAKKIPVAMRELVMVRFIHIMERAEMRSITRESK